MCQLHTVTMLPGHLQSGRGHSCPICMGQRPAPIGVCSILLMRGAHNFIAIGLWALRCSLSLWAWRQRLASPCVSSGMSAPDSRSFMANWPSAKWLRAGQAHEMACMCPRRTAPSNGLKLHVITIAMASQIKLGVSPCHELPMSIARLWALVQFRVGSHALPIEQGWFVRPSLPRHLCHCNLCPQFQAIRVQYPKDTEGY